jgi:hypothetical protein
MYVLLEDAAGRLVLRRLRFWHQLLARGLAARFDRQLAAGARPETRPGLAARAMQLTSARFRADLAASLRGLLAEADSLAGSRTQTPRRPGDRPSHGVRTAGELALLAGGGRSRRAAGPGSPGSVYRPRVPICQSRIRRSAPELADLAGRLAAPGPVPARGVAMVGQLLADGLGPLYRPACREDLGTAVAGAARALAG